MGALTLKTFPFELRGWDIEKFESIDPTDGFGSSTRVYISKQQVIQIEPDHSATSSKAWLTDKGRQFFDGIFGTWNNKNKQSKNLILKKESWKKNIKTLLKTLYLFEHCRNKTKKSHFFTLVFEHVGIETLCLLKVIEHNCSFVKLRTTEKSNTSNDIEFDFQLNAIANTNKLKSSNLCLVVAANTRYEGASLNLNLRQRYFKGNFKCLVLGSLINLTFPTTFLGTNLEALKKLAEGNSFICQDFKAATNPLLIFSNEFCKRTDSNAVIKMFKTSKYTNILSQTWNGINILNPTLNETSIQNIDKFIPLKYKDLSELSSFYFVNVNTRSIANLKRITETKLLKPLSITKNQQNIKELFLDQNSYNENNQNFSKSIESEPYCFLPVKMFYENEETFISTEGLIKRTKKLISTKKTREGWTILRNLLKNFQNQSITLNSSANKILSFNATKRSNFSNFMYLQYCAVEKLDSSTLSIAAQNQPFFIWSATDNFKQKSSKIKNTKSKYWIDDFFTGGKDEYSKNSLVLSNCSKILRTQSTNFF